MKHRPSIWTVTVDDELVELFISKELAVKWLRLMKFLKSSTYPTLWHRDTERAHLEERKINVN